MSAELTTGPAQNAGPRYLLLGEILRPHGVRGELRMRILTDYPERIKKLKTVYVGMAVDAADVREYHVQYMRKHQDYGLLKLAEIDDRDQADLLRALFVMVPIEKAVPLDEGEFYLYQVIGLSVQTTEGQIIGTIREVLETGANDVYVIDSPEYGEVLIPVTEDIVIKTDIPGQTVIIRLMDGLLPG
jgi:16S rRNA processing protein RimM